MTTEATKWASLKFTDNAKANATAIGQCHELVILL